MYGLHFSLALQNRIDFLSPGRSSVSTASLAGTRTNFTAVRSWLAHDAITGQMSTFGSHLLWKVNLSLNGGLGI